MNGTTSHTNQIQPMRFKSQTAFSNPSAEVYQLLGGNNLLLVEIRDFNGAHHAIQSGLPVHSVFYLADCMKHQLSLEILSQVVGLTLGTLRRKKAATPKTLNCRQHKEIDFGVSLRFWCEQTRFLANQRKPKIGLSSHQQDK